jgi:hypothetical protein
MHKATRLASKDGPRSDLLPQYQCDGSSNSSPKPHIPMWNTGRGTRSFGARQRLTDRNDLVVCALAHMLR